jgi:hypothetical protein
MSPQWYGTYLRTKYPQAFVELPGAGTPKDSYKALDR